MHSHNLVLDVREVAQHDHQRARMGRRRVEVPEHRALLREVLVVGVHLHRDHRVSTVSRQGRHLNEGDRTDAAERKEGRSGRRGRGGERGERGVVEDVERVARTRAQSRGS